MPKKPTTAQAAQRQLAREAIVRDAVQAALAVALAGDCKAWNVKTCRVCRRERTVAIHFAAKVYRTHDQLWLPSDVEATCVDCKAAALAERWAGECQSPTSVEHRSRCELLVSWLPPSARREQQVLQHRLEEQLVAQRGRCCYCGRLIHNLRVTDDPRRFLSIPQRVRYEVVLDPVVRVGLQFDQAKQLVRLCHRECVPAAAAAEAAAPAPGWLWVDPPSGNLRDDQQIRLQALMREVQAAYRAWLPSQARLCQGRTREQRILDVHRTIQRFYLLFQAGTAAAAQWNAWIQSDRAFARAAKATICGQAVDGESVVRLAGEEEAGEEEEEKEGPADELAAEVGGVTRTPGSTEPTDELWRRLCNGARARSRRRGCGHLETLTAGDLARCWETQRGRCAKCTLPMQPISAVSANRICTLQMNNIYGNGNCNLMHAECNIADAPNNLEEWLNGLLVHYRFVQPGPGGRLASSQQDAVLPPELVLQRDELRTKWERKHSALMRNAVRIQSTLQFASALHRRSLHPQYGPLAESIYEQHGPQSPSTTSLMAAESSVTKAGSPPSPSSSPSSASSSAKLPSSSTCAACTDKSKSSE